MRGVSSEEAAEKTLQGGDDKVVAPTEFGAMER